MDKRILITGANGLVGRELSKKLLELGYTVHALSRNPNAHRALEGVNFFHWDVEAEKIDPKALVGVSAIIHLAGERIVSWPWTKKRKRKIIDSRVKSIALLYKTIAQLQIATIDTVVSASATGYYPGNKDEILTESSRPATGFLGISCFLWEHAVEKGNAMNMRTVCLRNGVVLSNRGGIYAVLKKQANIGLGTILGDGRQWIPWVQLEDVVNAYIFALENLEMNGVFNLVAPHQIRFDTLMQITAKAVGKKIWLPNVPAFVLKTILGEMSDLILCSHRVSADKLQDTGFQFTYPTIDSAVAKLQQV